MYEILLSIGIKTRMYEILLSIGMKTRSHDLSRAHMFLTCFTNDGNVSNEELSKKIVGDCVYFKGIANPIEVVGKGWIASMDPSTEVGEVELKVNWCEIHVQIPIIWGEHLMRPYASLKIVGIVDTSQAGHCHTVGSSFVCSIGCLLHKPRSWTFPWLGTSPHDSGYHQNRVATQFIKTMKIDRDSRYGSQKYSKGKVLGTPLCLAMRLAHNHSIIRRIDALFNPNT
ncbi:hypothetical protein RHMOL_Rhmol02G0218900 [Rhododendron molle]|uniref:Uncharacterized protein n=1 Tax=Rhododendron molle TaxID=49168 RepID=A0ACC0PV65_RHOML|nr:hypothetical protein RHMOL_Rhmol02G0218900 [Rhododendron molle]